MEVDRFVLFFLCFFLEPVASNFVARTDLYEVARVIKNNADPQCMAICNIYCKAEANSSRA